MMMPFSRPSSEMINIDYKLPETSRLQNAYTRPLVICSPDMSLSILGTGRCIISCRAGKFP